MSRYATFGLAAGLAALALSVGSASAAVVLTNSDGVIRNSLCVGTDCPNSPAFGFDTVILQENNTRLFFLDTSTSAGFPSTDWRLTANDSASGGMNKFSIDDVTTGRIPFLIEGGAPTNSLRIEADGDIGLGTANPVVELHIVDGDTPTVRLDQDGSSGFAPQTWDLAGNETNFFVRDVTHGSLLPFRIKPSAPTNSLFVAASGALGVGTATPTPSTGATAASIDIVSSTNPELHLHSTASGTGALDGANLTLANTDLFLTNRENGSTLFFVNGAERMRITGAGVVSIAGLASCSAGIQTDASGVLSCLPSTRALKNISGALDPELALANVMALSPQVGAYKTTPDVPEHWLIAEDAAEIEPAFVGLRDGEPFTVKTYGVVADLVAVIQAQQRRIEALELAVQQR